MATIDYILNRHNLKEVFHNGKIMDPEERLFISDNYVIKLYYPKKFEYFENELEVYNSLSSKEYLPKLIFSGKNSQYKYIVISKIYGLSLFDSWKKLSTEERKKYLKDLSIILRDINNIKSNITSFQSTIKNSYEDSLSKLNYSLSTIETFENIFNENIGYITNNESSSLIHIDTHFYNFMISNSSKLIAYDFEHTIMAPRDYQLVRLYRMNYYPESFIYPKGSLSNSEIKEYEGIMFEIINNYPEIINSNTKYRLKVYLLDYLLKEAIRCNINEKDVLEIVEKNKNIKLR